MDCGDLLGGDDPEAYQEILNNMDKEEDKNIKADKWLDEHDISELGGNTHDRK